MKTIHPVLLELAVNLKDFDYNRIAELYVLYKKKRSDIVSDVRRWLDDGIIEGRSLSQYTYGAYVHISSKHWIELLRNVETVKYRRLSYDYGYRSSYDKHVETLHQFIMAFHEFLQTGKVAKKLPELDITPLFSYDMWMKKHIFEIIRHPGCTKFAQAMNQNVLGWLFNNIIKLEWRILLNPVSPETIRSVYIDNPSIPSISRNEYLNAFLYEYEVLHNGNLREIKSKLPDGYREPAISGAIELFDGNHEQAFRLFSADLKQQANIAYHNPLFAFFYGLSIGMTGSDAALKVGEKLLKNKVVASSSNYYPLLVVLHHFLRGDAADFVKAYPPQIEWDNLSSLLCILFVKHYKLLPTAMQLEPWAERFVLNRNSNMLKLLFADDFPSIKPMAQLLREQTGLLKPLMPPVRKLEDWERVIDKVMKNMEQEKKKKTSSKRPEENVERIIYLINMEHLELQPKLQKSKDGGVTWSKGRNVAMNRFAACQEPAMTQQDVRVANQIQMSAWYGDNKYYLEGPLAVAELVGSQVVFDDTTNQRIDIVEEPLQLLVQPEKDGFKVKSNVEVKKMTGSVFIKQEGDKQLTIVRADERQRTILKLLVEVKKFPAESKQQLTKMLETLSINFTVMSPLLKNSQELKTVKSSPIIIVQLAPTEGQQYQASLAVKPFGTHPPYQRPAQGMEVVSTTINGERVQTERNMKKEKANLNELLDLLSQFDNAAISDESWMLDTQQALQMLDIIRQHQDICCVEWPKGVRMRVVKPMLTPDNLKLKISSAGQWFELEGDVQIDKKTKIKMAELMAMLSASSEGNFVRLSDDEYVALSEQLRRQLQALDKVLAGRGKQLKVAQVNGMQLSALEELGVQMEADKKFRKMLDKIKEAGKKEFKVPANIHAELRPYQLTGYEWMSRLAWWGAGACLADDMGLGKTLQAITLMQSRAQQGPQLVVVPTSLLHNWQQELKRFAPALNARNLNQPGADRAAIVNSAVEADIVISTYGLLVTEGKLLASRTWTTIVLDEAHSIKNKETQTSKGAMELKADFRLLLTGTPLQNHLSEIWNLFQFANPGLLGSFKQFAERFIIPVERDHDKDRQRLLKRLISPFLLRRTKDEVLDELPEKTEITLRVELSPEEKALYDNLRQQAIANIEEGGNTPMQTLAEITKLRQAACHPKLINPKLKLSSSKTQAFLELVDTLRSGGHRVLVFSQFTSHLALIREELDSKEVPYLYLDGSHSPAQRNKLVQQFQTGDMPLFLISLKAGGLGLNLTAADYVIHLDPWWNPAIEDQASDRAHRIGQERPVTVYRIIAADTIEEKIIRLHQNKRSMADALLQDADMHAQISAEDVAKLLRESVEEIG